MTLRTERIHTLEQMRASVKGNESSDSRSRPCTSAYALIRRTLVRFEVHSLRKPAKGNGGAIHREGDRLLPAQLDRLTHQLLHPP